jgi:hypothetical protein
LATFQLEPEEEEVAVEDQIIQRLSTLRNTLVTTMDDLTKIRDQYRQTLSVYQDMMKHLSEDYYTALSSVANTQKNLGLTVIAAVVTPPYIPLAKNFLCFLRSLENGPQVLIVGVTDQGT